MMQLEDRIRRETASERDRLRHLKEERLPALGRDESRLNRELAEANDEERRQSGELQSVRDSLDHKSHQKQRLAQLKKKLDEETGALIDRSVEIEGRIKKLQDEKCDLEEEHERKRTELHSITSERDGLLEELRATCLSVASNYMLDLRSWVLEQCLQSQCLREQRKVLEEFERARATDTEVMELWDTDQELTRLLAQVTVGPVKDRLNELRAEVRGQIESRFPNALELRAAEQWTSPEGYLYTVHDNSGHSWTLLPVNAEDAEQMVTSRHEAEAEVLARLVWAVSKCWNVTAQNLTLSFSASGWLVLDVDNVTSAATNPVVSVDLPGGESMQLHVRNAPDDCTEAIRPADATALRFATGEAEHPLSIVACLATNSDFEDLWPEPADGLIATLARLRGGTGQAGTEGAPAREAQHHRVAVDLEDSEIHAVVELANKKKWGNRGVPEDALKRYLRGCKDPMTSIRRLAKKGIIVDRGHKTYSLNRDMSDVIRLIVDEGEEGSSQ